MTMGEETCFPRGGTINRGVKRKPDEKIEPDLFKVTRLSN